jgi:hypothetical protein
MPRVPTDILNEKSAAYFNETREKIVGMPLSEYGKKEGGEEVWAKAEPGFKELAEILKANDSGPFVEGDTREFKVPLESCRVNADLVFLSILLGFHYCGHVTLLQGN